MFVIDYSNREVDSVAFAPVGTLLAVGYEHQWVGVWDISTREHLDGVVRDRFYTHPEFRFVPGGSRFHYLKKFGEREWRDPDTREHGTLSEGTGWVENAVMTPDSQRLLVYERGYCVFRLIDITRGKTGKQLWEVPVYGRGTWGMRVSIELHPDGERFFVAESHRNSRTRIAVRELETGKLLGASRLPNTTVTNLALAPDGASAVVTSGTSIFIFNADKLAATPRRIANDGRKHFTGIAFHLSGRYLAATSNDETVKLYDTITWEVAKTFTWNIGRMRSIAFNPDGALAAAGSDSGKVVVWDVDL